MRPNRCPVCKRMIDNLTSANIPEGGYNELSNLIYDTLMQNTIHNQLDIECVDYCEISGEYITFRYKGRKVLIHVTEE